MLLKLTIFFCLFFGVSNAFCQLKVGTNPVIINGNAILELESNNKGILLPRLGLTATNNFSPLSAFVAGMFVYNTNTAGAGVTAVSPGVYYSDGTQWVKLSASAIGASGWQLAGNSGTNPALNFLGTTDNVPLILKTNNVEAFRITSDGKIGIGQSSPIATLDINGNLKIDSVQTGSITDSILVIGANNIVKKISANALTTGIYKKLEIVATTGQVAFTTPNIITDPNKIMLYRNGVTIEFTVTGSNIITAEIASIAGDEIKIVQTQ